MKKWKKWSELNDLEKQTRIHKIQYWVLEGLQVATCIMLGYRLCRVVNLSRRAKFDKKYTHGMQFIKREDDGKYHFSIARLDPKTGEYVANGFIEYRNADDMRKAFHEGLSLVDNFEGVKTDG